MSAAKRYPRRCRDEVNNHLYAEQVEHGGTWRTFCDIDGRDVGCLWTNGEVEKNLQAGRWVETFDHLEAPAVDFACPHCGGSHFGRSTAATDAGQVVALSTVRCHDEREVGCRWRGDWPMSERTPKIDRELAAMRKALEAGK